MGTKSQHQYSKALLTDFLFLVLRHNGTNDVPGWTGFNRILQGRESVEKSTLYYLPVIEASPTEMTTVNTILAQSVEMADRLQVNSMVLVFDQAIYAKAQQIRWKDEKLTSRLVIRLGEFHTIMSFVGIIGKRFKAAGLQDIFIESQLIDEGSVNGVMSGHMYNRSMRCHKLMFEALQHLRFEAFLNSLPEEQAENINAQIDEVADEFLLDPSHFQHDFELLHQQYQKFVENQSAENPTFAFWSSYLEMVQLLLSFIRATRESNWELHLELIRLMVPWFFSYDRMNYARYLPAYWLEMSKLIDTHPNCYDQQFMKGHWTVNRQDRYPFAAIACDQAIEQTVNRDCKTKGLI